MWRRSITIAVGFLFINVGAGGISLAQSAPLDLWTEQVMASIRDPRTLSVKIIPRDGYFEVFYNSEIGDAKWADSGPPYEVHGGDTIRIHGYLATPLIGGPYPGIVIGHGHHGHGSPEMAMTVAAFGYVALSIDGPQAGQSTGGPQDTEQAWISVEEVINVPSPAVSYLYHYAYAGMRGLTLLEYLSNLAWPYRNPFRIDRNRLGVMGASMGGQFTYFINGIDSRVKAAVAIAVAGDWHKLLFYPGAWLYHGLYYYTRDGIPSRQDDLNTISDVCLDPTTQTFLNYFDPISYAPTQHAPLLTIIGTHDQYFPVPAINTTYDQVASAGTHPRFRKNILLAPNGKHGVLRTEDDLKTLLTVIQDVHAWFRYSFDGAAGPPDTPAVTMRVEGEEMVFTVAVVPGSRPIRTVDLWFATQIDTFPEVANDFASIRLEWTGSDYEGRLPFGAVPPSGPPAGPDNILYFATVKDWANFTISSKMYYKAGELSFCDDFVPRIEHFPRDDFPVPPTPAPNCSCPAADGGSGAPAAAPDAAPTCEPTSSCAQMDAEFTSSDSGFFMFARHEGTGELWAGTYGGRIYVKRDGHWQLHTQIPDTEAIFRLVYHPGSSTLYANLEREIKAPSLFRLDGDTWVSTGIGDGYPEGGTTMGHGLGVGADGLLYAGVTVNPWIPGQISPNYLWRSADGVTWESFTPTDATMTEVFGFRGQTYAITTGVGRLLRLSGSAWEPLFSDPNRALYHAAPFGDAVYITGERFDGGGALVYRWDGTSLELVFELGPGGYPYFQQMAVVHDELGTAWLYVGWSVQWRATSGRSAVYRTRNGTDWELYQEFDESECWALVRGETPHTLYVGTRHDSGNGRIYSRTCECAP